VSPGPLLIQRLDPRARLPERAHEDDAGLDLRALEPVLLRPGQRVSVGTGLAIALPDGHAGLVLPRSGLASRHGLAVVNSPGLIDRGYRGEILVLLVNTDRTQGVSLAADDRIAQLVVVPVAVPKVIEASHLPETARGRDGFGSTGSA